MRKSGRSHCTLTDCCVLCNSSHVIVAYKFWCMIIYVADSDIYIANGDKCTVIGLYEMGNLPSVTQTEGERKRKEKEKNQKVN